MCFLTDKSGGTNNAFALSHLFFIKRNEEKEQVGEHAYLGPDLRYGKQFIKMLREALNE